MRQRNHRHFRLLVIISVLFTALIIVFCLFFRQFIYWQTSNLLLEESDRCFSQIKDELTLDFQAPRRAVSQTVHILSRTEITSAATLDERLRFVPIFQAALQEEPTISGLQVGYESGDYFIVRLINDVYMRIQWSIPPMADTRGLFVEVSGLVSHLNRKSNIHTFQHKDIMRGA
jgi:hypothetical protein